MSAGRVPRKIAAPASRDLSGRLLRLQDEQRRALAHKLHDTTGQHLALVELLLATLHDGDMANAKALRTLTRVRELARQASDEIRSLSCLLHPPLIDEIGLLGALRSYVIEFSASSGIAITLDAPPAIDRLDHETELSLFRVVQEALTNVLRHSGSPSAVLSVRQRPDELELEIADRGCGLLSASLDHAAQLGVGMVVMRERMRQLHGTLEIVTSSGCTRVLARLPLTCARPGSPATPGSASS